MSKRFNVGQKVRISFCSGINSGKIGRIIPLSSIKKNEHGIPMLEGHYCPIDSKRESALQTDSGEVIIMYNNRLSELLD